MKPVIKLRDHYQGPQNCYAVFMCPGCHSEHILGIADGCTGARWTWNGDLVRPTFTPSVASRGHKLELDAKGEWTGEWARDAAGNLIPSVCHSFVTDGQIQFLPDCTHELANQTVPLQPWPESENTNGSN